MGLLFSVLGMFGIAAFFGRILFFLIIAAVLTTAGVLVAGTFRVFSLGLRLGVKILYISLTVFWVIVAIILI